MGRRDDMLRDFEARERQRAQQWQAWGDRARPILRAARDRADIQSGVITELVAPSAVGLVTVPEWHSNGVVVQADDLQVFVRVVATGDDGLPSEVAVHPVSACPDCGRPAPLDEVTEEDDFAAAMYAGSPVDGHDCRSVQTADDGDDG